jgi:hypothetical protein
MEGVVSKYSSAVSSNKSSITSISNNVSSSSNSWYEIGLKTLQDLTIPSIVKIQNVVESNINTLSTVSGKVSNLVSQISSLKDLCDKYDACNSEEEKENKKYLATRISSKESEIDGIISQINGVSVEDVQVTLDAIASAKEEFYSIDNKKLEFCGDVDDPSQFYYDPSWSTKLAHMTLFDNTTGEILKDGDTLNLKPGETRVLTVKLPNYCGMIDEVTRTTAQADYSGVISNYSDIDPDPNNVEYVRYGYHTPSAGTNLHFNTYEWVITANRDGTFLASQTCEFKAHGTDSNGKTVRYRGKKAMVAIHVNVSS